MLTRRTALASAAVMPFAGVQAATAQTPPPTLEALSRKPSLVAASISPDGTKIALLRELREGEKRIAFIQMVDTAAPTIPPKRIVLGDHDVEWIQWANDERVLIGLMVERPEHYTPTGSNLGRKLEFQFRRMFSVGLGGDVVVMLGDEKKIHRIDANLSVLVDILPNDPKHILMRAADPRSYNYAIYKVDVTTGQGEQVEQGAPRTYRWETENGVPVLRFDWDYNKVNKLYARAPGETEWKFVRRIIVDKDVYRPEFEILGMSEQAGVWLVKTNLPNEGTDVVRRYDLKTLQFGEVVSSRPDIDAADVVLSRERRLVATRYVADRNEYAFVDTAMAPHFRGMDKFFSSEASVHIAQLDQAQLRMLIVASGPRMANAWYWYDRKAAKLQPLGLSRPWLPLDSLAPAQALSVKSRDGVALRAYLTGRPSATPQPLIVMPHGGPEVRDEVEFDTFAQAFAAQGWLVLQPNFRGSGGYGRAFAEAGHGRWGDRMQDDVDDAVAHVLASGRADPKRVAVWGYSYGGYAAMMAAARHPELYRCAVAGGGVFDLPAMMAEVRKSGEDSPIYAFWVKRIGDPATALERLKRDSPRNLADRVEAPVLLFHGLDDDTVPFQQSRMMAQALRSAGKSVEHLELKDSDHNGWTAAVMQQVLETSVRFLKANLA